MPELSFMEAITRAQREEMARDPTVLLIGEDVRGNIYGKSRGLFAEFGPKRVLDTPISEAAFVGAAIGAAMTGMRPIVDLAIASFVYVSMDQLVSQAAKMRYMFGGQARVPIVVRAGMFYGGGTAAQHSDRPYPLFMHIPGFKVVVPSTPRDASGLLKAAIRDDDPVLFFEDGGLASLRGEVPEDEEVIPLGLAENRREGGDVTIVAIGGSVRHALTAAATLEQEGISADVIDPRTLVPLDVAAILKSVARTRHLVIADPAHRTCGAAAEIAAMVAEEAFADLSGPIVRVTTPQTHIPFSPAMERPLYPNPEKIADAVRRVVGGKAQASAAVNG
jgi:pyruvate/2-oxoglutarate/acetoin dehydrogenase E1 component